MLKPGANTVATIVKAGENDEVAKALVCEAVDSIVEREILKDLKRLNPRTHAAVSEEIVHTTWFSCKHLAEGRVNIFLRGLDVHLSSLDIKIKDSEMTSWYNTLTVPIRKGSPDYKEDMFGFVTKIYVLGG